MKKVKCKVMIMFAMLAIPLPIASLALVGCAGGCATKKVAEGSEVFVVRAEQTYKNLDKSFRAFSNLEANNRAVFQRISPKIEQAANTVRTDGFDAIIALQGAVENYKANRTPENRDKISHWLQKVELVEKAVLDYQNTAKLSQ